ncbi:unnamed protein product [Thlaspi arvense]|uniref:Uncharacterized protein n=1 Tax=Thlaspi arvense TaxID=13288 RepID=A0AAU9S0H3_THLAR|nr:unnamed protein product [Thlaspi arvense]
MKFLCVLMFHVSNIVKVNGLTPVCKKHMIYPGKCAADVNKQCQAEMKDRYTTYKRCDCENTLWKRVEHHYCHCYIKLPCPKEGSL